MALWPMRSFDRDMDPMRDFDRFERRMMRGMDRFQRRMMPYWRDEDQSILHIANQAHKVVNDDKKFAVLLDVSKFKPEELQVHIDGRNLTTEGKQEEKTEHGHMERSFVRSWTLPDEADLDAVHTQPTDVGHLYIEAPKTGLHTNRRTLPIQAAHKSK